MTTRCAWVSADPLDQKYHDEEWGKPSYDDRYLFEMLILEGAQAGLSWLTILKKREGYRQAFYNFEVQTCLNLTDDYLESCLENPDIIRNRLKVYSVRTNAEAFIKVQEEFGSFSAYLWGFVNDEPVINQFQSMSEVPAKTVLSDQISKDMKKRGFKFIGTTIIYAYMQAVGVVNDHLLDCNFR